MIQLPSRLRLRLPRKKRNMMRIYNKTVVERQQAMLLSSRSLGVLANQRERPV
jgi:hypothetical protein